MSNLSWWRSWHGAPTDHKWPVIAARSGVKVGEVSAIAWALFDYASQQDDRGSVAGFDAEEYAVYSGFPEEEVIAVIRAMEEKGIITADGRLTNWEKRQPKREDDSNGRVRKHRDMKRSVTQCNADDSAETPQIKIQIKSTDTDTDTDAEQEPPQPPGLDPDFAALCRKYEGTIGPLTPTTSDMLRDDLEKYGLQNCTDAIGECVAQNVYKWKYARAILERWRVEGRASRKPAAPSRLPTAADLGWTPL